MSIIRKAGLAAAFISITATHPAFAQVTGSILGTVVDQTGVPLRGVKVTADSPTQIGGARVAYSDGEGSFRFVNLQPGIFRVVASAPKLSKVEQRGIAVGVSNPASVDLVMEVASAVEEVKIIEKGPVVNVRSATVRETFDEEFLDGLPLESRDSYESVLQNNTPGVAYGQTRVRGGDAKSTVYMMDGFRINSHGVQGVSPQLATLKSVAAMEMQTAGYGAEYATAPGAVLNLVTKSGSNKLEVDVSGYHMNDAMRFFREQGEADPGSHDSKLNLNFSGPIIRDKLWYFGTAEVGYAFSRKDPDPLGLRPTAPPYQRMDLRGTLKLTYQITPRNKLQTIQKVDYNDRMNTQGTTSSAADAQLLTRDQNSLHTLRWESLLTDNLFLRAGAAYNRFYRHWMPESCRRDIVACMHDQPVVQQIPFGFYLMGNYSEARQLSGQSIEILSELEWFVNHGRLGDHDFKLVGRYARDLFQELRSTPSGGILYMNGSDPDRMVYWYANDPRTEPGRDGWNIQSGSSGQAELSLQDAFRPNRHTTLSLGAAFTDATVWDQTGRAVLSFTEVLPSVSAVWDATHDGRTALRGSIANRLQTGNSDLGRFALGSRANQTCRFDPSTGGFTNCGNIGGDFGGNKAIGSPCGPSGVDLDGSDCRHEVKAPKMWEYTLGVEREVWPGVALSLDAIYRHYYNLLDNQQVNRNWTDSGYTLDPLSPSRDGTNFVYSNLDNVPGAVRRYRGVTTSLHKREGALKVQAAYTWSQLEGNVLDSNVGFQPGSTFGKNPARDAYLYGYLPDDARHAVRLGLVYQVTRWFSSGITYSYTSGRPYSRRFRNEVDNGFTDYRAQIGVNPGTNINDPSDDRPLRRPDLTVMNLQLRVNLKPLTGQTAELFTDILNVLALRTAQSVEENDAGTWGTPSGYLEPFRMRVGFRFAY